MGGHALTEGLTERKQATDYFIIKKRVMDLFVEGSDIINVTEIIEMPEKTSFGDLDLVYTLHKGKSHEDFITMIRLIFSPTEIFHNGDITSFDFNTFQVDMIKCDQSNYQITQFCLSFGDRGMILGQIARACGFSLVRYLL
jgi:hypothetical protein